MTLCTPQVMNKKVIKRQSPKILECHTSPKSVPVVSAIATNKANASLTMKTTISTALLTINISADVARIRKQSSRRVPGPERDQNQGKLIVTMIRAMTWLPGGECRLPHPWRATKKARETGAVIKLAVVPAAYVSWRPLHGTLPGTETPCQCLEITIRDKRNPPKSPQSHRKKSKRERKKSLEKKLHLDVAENVKALYTRTLYIHVYITSSRLKSTLYGERVVVSQLSWNVRGSQCWPKKSRAL